MKLRMPRWFVTVLFGISLGAFINWLDVPFQDAAYRLVLRLRGTTTPNPGILLLDPQDMDSEETLRFAKRLKMISPKAVKFDFRLNEKEAEQLRRMNFSFPIGWNEEFSDRTSDQWLPFVSFVTGIHDQSLQETMGNDDVPETSFIRKLSPAAYKRIRTPGTPHLINVAGPPGTYPIVPLRKLIDDNSMKSLLKDKIVLIGPPIDRHHVHMGSVPFFPRSGSSGIQATEVHANAIDSILTPNSYQIAPPWISTLVTVSVSITASAILFYTVPVLGILLIVMALGLVVFLSLILLGSNIYLDILKPGLAIAVAYYFLIPYRLIIEYKGRWKYQQENRLLSEVETLKDNFMSLVSHNLKTPIARIEGAIEMLLSDRNLSKERLQSELRAVLQSTGELNKFVSRVLNLTRVEHPEYQLNVENHDLNNLIEEIYRALEPEADEKSLKIELDLEPLFPILMDGELIKESITNLVENAIKYTPNDGRIRVATEDCRDWVKIVVEDSGPGIPDIEKENVFSKFFRGSSVKNKGIRGSGLGLYLAKYFVELHGGSISINDSDLGGARFEIQLIVK